MQRIHAAVRPPEAARNQVTILRELMAALGKAEEFVSTREVLDAMGREAGPFKGVSWEAVGDQGMVLATG